MAFILENGPTAPDQRLSRWRRNSPFVQSLLLGLVIVCGPGINTTVVGLGAGGSRPSNVATVDKVTLVGGTLISFTSFFAGSIINKLGPKYTLMIGAAGYPLYIGSLWWLDQGRSLWLPYFFAVIHGVCAALYYSAIVYIATAYAPENHRGKYVASIYFSIAFGSALGSGIVLGITAKSSSTSSSVPPSVYTAIIAVQCAGILFSACLISPRHVRRNDGRAIAIFKSLSWQEELAALPRTMVSPRLLLLSVALFSSQMSYSLTGSLNAFYFNARTRALVNFCFWVSSAFASALFGLLCDSKRFGFRRRRTIIASGVVATLFIGPFAALFWFLTTNDLNRQLKPHGVDWSAPSGFTGLLVIYIFLGAAVSIFLGYLAWLCSTFSNEPKVLSRFSGYIEGLKALGLIVAFGIDSNHVSFMKESAAYFTLIMVGIVLCVVSASIYTKDTKYGDEELVIVPAAFEVDRESFAAVVEIPRWKE